jgi:hypothetical protein
MHSPTDEHWNGVKHILRYLKGTIFFDLHIRNHPSFELHAYSDADWIGCLDDRRWTSDFCVFFGSNLLSWDLRSKQPFPNLALRRNIKAWPVLVQSLLDFNSYYVSYMFQLPLTQFFGVRNLGETLLASNLIFHTRMKHIEIDYHFVGKKSPTSN